MKRKGLYLMIVLALGGVAVTAQAQDMQDSGAMSTSSTNYDGRWYIAPTIGGYYNDTDRNTNSRQWYFGIGVGKFISPNTSIDFFMDHTGRDRDSRGRWDNNAYGVAARFYMGGWDAWRPYLLAGIMGDYHYSDSAHGWSPAAELGIGLSKTLGENAIFRVDAAYRQDWDDETQPMESGYGDWMLGVSLLAMLGNPPAPPPPPAPVAPPPPPAPTCDQLDDDGDNVNNCVDQCPNSAAGSIVGPDGCPQKVVIDLRGVNFKFDRPDQGETEIAPTLQEPTSDSMAILKQAVDTLKRYPKVTVKVAGYTDSIGTEQYNQALSERRATIVYDYLTGHGVDASRLEGPVGYGESHPIATNETAEGRARNRRTELQVDQAASGVQVEQQNGMQQDDMQQDGM